MAVELVLDASVSLSPLSIMATGRQPKHTIRRCSRPADMGAP